MTDLTPEDFFKWLQILADAERAAQGDISQECLDCDQTACPVKQAYAAYQERRLAYIARLN
jgi:hypothetical protein